MQTIIGIDPGLAATGIGIVSGHGVKVIQFAYGVIKTEPNCSVPERLERIFAFIEKVLDDEKPHLMVIEDVFSLEKYPQSGITLGKVCGVILLAAQKKNIPILEVPVREAKQVLTGNGNASKQQLEMAVRQALGRDRQIRPFHASDALGLALIGLYRYAREG